MSKPLYDDELESVKAEAEKNNTPPPDIVLRMVEELQTLRRECFSLAANQCHDGYAGENGDHGCKIVDRLTAERDDAAGSFNICFRAGENSDEHMAKILACVKEQAQDDGLWFHAETAPEGYQQQELRRLHAIIEDDKVVLALLSNPHDDV